MSKSYIYLLTEGEATEMDRVVGRAFKKFQEVHEGDTEVIFLTPEQPDFAKARDIFEIRKTPAFAISDEPCKFEGGDPHLMVDRDGLDKFDTEDKIYQFITDLHYAVLDDRILHYKAGIAMHMLGAVLRAAWDELKDIVKIQVAPF